LAVAIPSRLILPSNITLVEQGIKCSPFGVSISNSGAAMVAGMVFRLLRASIPQAIHQVSNSIMDGVVAWITRGRGNLAGVRQSVPGRSADQAAATW
jgi:hypothetical protein